MYDNQLSVLEGLGSLAQLRHLYMQNNEISSVNAADLTGLTRLKKLYLNGNCLRSLAPLAPLTGLVELHANGQRLPPGEALDVAPEVLELMTSIRCRPAGVTTHVHGAKGQLNIRLNLTL